MNDIIFDYYRGVEAEQYSFYRIPKMLFTDTIFQDLSCEAKVLYGLMLDRMSLSLKNHWMDEEERVYIIFTVNNICDLMNCGTQKAVRLLKELDVKTGIGLIEKKRLGLGKPNVIYEAFLKIQGFKNYRAKLIEFYYCVMIDELKDARILFSELNKLVGTMLLNDLIMFAYTEALYHEKLNELQESYTLLIGLEKLTLPFKFLDCLVKETKVKILYKINSNLFLANIQSFKNICLKYNAYDKMQVADDMVKRYMVRNRYFALLELDENNKADHDYLLYEEISSNDEIHNRKGYSPFTRLLYLKKTHNKDYDAQYKLLNEKLTPEEDLVLKITEESVLSDQYYHDVMEIYYPMALAIGDEIIITLVENELVRLLQNQKRYLRIVDIYLNSSKRKKELGFFC